MEETQEEEREVLRSIYDGDENFKEISPTCFQYKYGLEDKSFLLEISWPCEYPSDLPIINLDTFFNNSLPSELKDEIKAQLLEQAEELRDSAMTYSLFDWMNENSQQFIDKIPEFTQKENAKEEKVDESQSSSKSKDKKENLTKAQKRRITDRTNYKGERERGWDWVDVVKHLCQTGAAKN